MKDLKVGYSDKDFSVSRGMSKIRWNSKSNSFDKQRLNVSLVMKMTSRRIVSR